MPAVLCGEANLRYARCVLGRKSKAWNGWCSSPRGSVGAGRVSGGGKHRKKVAECPIFGRSSYGEFASAGVRILRWLGRRRELGRGTKSLASGLNDGHVEIDARGLGVELFNGRLRPVACSSSRSIPSTIQTSGRGQGCGIYWSRLRPSVQSPDATRVREGESSYMRGRKRSNLALNMTRYGVLFVAAHRRLYALQPFWALGRPK